MRNLPLNDLKAIATQHSQATAAGIDGDQENPSFSSELLHFHRDRDSWAVRANYTTALPEGVNDTGNTFPTELSWRMAIRLQVNHGRGLPILHDRVGIKL